MAIIPDVYCDVLIYNYSLFENGQRIMTTLTFGQGGDTFKKILSVIAAG